MLYVATPSSPEIRAAMSRGDLACMTTPAQGNVVPDGAAIVCDNGKYGHGWPGPERWFTWLSGVVDRYGADRILFAVAPDVPFSSTGTLAESLPWLPQIRGLDIPAAFAAQDGCEEGDLIPWDFLDAVFLAGSTAWKVGPLAEKVAHEAKARGKWVHMGRVNSLRRLRIAEQCWCDSADGTYLAFGPDRNLPTLLGWLDELHGRPSLLGNTSSSPPPFPADSSGPGPV